MTATVELERCIVPRLRIVGEGARPRSLVRTATVFVAMTCVFAAASGDVVAQEPAQEVREQPGHGYTRKGAHIYFAGRRIDEPTQFEIDGITKVLFRPLRSCAGVDAASFEALSVEYTRDKNRVYYKLISPGAYIVEPLPKADPKTIEVVGFNLARDRAHVYWYGEILPDVDAKTLVVINDGFVWKDAKSVWYQQTRVQGADPETFEHLQQGFYRDARRVYWSGTELVGANPATFRTFGDASAYGADDRFVWLAARLLTGVDAATFVAIHQSVYKDKNGVFSAQNKPLPLANPKRFRKRADLDEHNSALLTDGLHHYVYLAYRGEVFRVESSAESLAVSRILWRGASGELVQVATSSAKLTASGWSQVTFEPGPTKDGESAASEAHVLSLHTAQFHDAWKLLRTRSK